VLSASSALPHPELATASNIGSPSVTRSAGKEVVDRPLRRAADADDHVEAGAAQSGTAHQVIAASTILARLRGSDLLFMLTR
jgi:hypothetical protein